MDSNRRNHTHLSINQICSELVHRARRPPVSRDVGFLDDRQATGRLQGMGGRPSNPSCPHLLRASTSFFDESKSKTWMAGTSPAMTEILFSAPPGANHRPPVTRKIVPVM
jgi:hypothetical protein